uniref:Putative ribonuclease H-like domain-containing protein n=1 Tax=Tanacetum cinerariifolium TaxID=118510 RepID=A0A6L2JC44_TANCI|nr:putative ribonuclease H-like domain-containing protein [Tanacetum cinerariifolium]
MYGTCNRRGIGHIPSQCPIRDLSTIRTRPSANFTNTCAQSSNASANGHSDTGANSHVKPDLEAMDNSKAYYGDNALHYSIIFDMVALVNGTRMTLSAHSSSIMNLIFYDSNAAISSISNVSPSLLLSTIFFDDEEVDIVIGILE